MNLIRIFIISDSLLFARGLKSLLAHESRVEIIGEETNMERAIEQLESMQPDVIILGNTVHQSSPVLEEIYLLKAKPGVKVVGLSLQSNELFVYQAARKVVKGVKDLVEAIQTDLSSSEARLF